VLAAATVVEQRVGLGGNLGELLALGHRL